MEQTQLIYGHIYIYFIKYFEHQIKALNDESASRAECCSTENSSHFEHLFGYKYNGWRIQI